MIDDICVPDTVFHGSVSDGELASHGLTIDQVVRLQRKHPPSGSFSGRSQRPSPASQSNAIQRTEHTNSAKRSPTRLSLPADWIAAGNGSVDLMWQLALVTLSSGAKAMVVGPTFGEYARANPLRSRPAGNLPVRSNTR